MRFVPSTMDPGGRREGTENGGKEAIDCEGRDGELAGEYDLSVTDLLECIITRGLLCEMWLRLSSLIKESGGSRSPEFAKPRLTLRYEYSLSAFASTGRARKQVSKCGCAWLVIPPANGVMETKTSFLDGFVIVNVHAG